MRAAARMPRFIWCNVGCWECMLYSSAYPSKFWIPNLESLYRSGTFADDLDMYYLNIDDDGGKDIYIRLGLNKVQRASVLRPFALDRLALLCRRCGLQSDFAHSCTVCRSLPCTTFLGTTRRAARTPAKIPRAISPSSSRSACRRRRIQKRKVPKSCEKRAATPVVSGLL